MNKSTIIVVITLVLSFYKLVLAQENDSPWPHIQVKVRWDANVIDSASLPWEQINFYITEKGTPFDFTEHIYTLAQEYIDVTPTSLGKSFPTEVKMDVPFSVSDTVGSTTELQFILKSAARSIEIVDNITATASSSNTDAGRTPDKAIDNDETTRWASLATDNEWYIIDLKQSIDIKSVVFHWNDGNNALEYKIFTSDDKTNWTEQFHKTNSNGGIDNFIFPNTVNARYIKWQGIKRNTEWGYSFTEVDVYKPNNEGNKIESEKSDIATFIVANDRPKKATLTGIYEPDTQELVFKYDKTDTRINMHNIYWATEDRKFGGWGNSGHIFKTVNPDQLEARIDVTDELYPPNEKNTRYFTHTSVTNYGITSRWADTVTITIDRTNEIPFTEHLDRPSNIKVTIQ